MNNKGISLVEVLIVMAILAILMIASVGILNPTALVNKGQDAQRKKDLGRMKVAFEEYFNDKGCYPTDDQINDTFRLRSAESCRTGAFSPWLNDWPCDPQGQPYLIAVEQSSCPKWFKFFTNLSNRNDSEIPKDWYTSMRHLGNGSISWLQANYGASSTNVYWYDWVLGSQCGVPAECSYRPGPSQCNPSNGNSCTGPNCFVGNCQDGCEVGCCRNGAPCD